MIRLGKRNTEAIRPRPIKVTINDENDLMYFIPEAKKRKDVEYYQNCSIVSDKTPQQLAYYKEVKQQLKTRMDNGETNLRIRHINDVPKIVSFRELK
ncbi:hypothetical protein Zmor_024038 [Zophobas morio]|uniref:Uncharacterized protein n=1 Tax=Zophobas morio TaxID=2755281 RepID=A0AA38HY57_9CUCU|nr:hypothetical protein Zmor_024038 [Zophobas morio]